MSRLLEGSSPAAVSWRRALEEMAVAEQLYSCSVTLVVNASLAKAGRAYGIVCLELQGRRKNDTRGRVVRDEMFFPQRGVASLPEAVLKMLPRLVERLAEERERPYTPSEEADLPF